MLCTRHATLAFHQQASLTPTFNMYVDLCTYLVTQARMVEKYFSSFLVPGLPLHYMHGGWARENFFYIPGYECKYVHT